MWCAADAICWCAPALRLPESSLNAVDLNAPEYYGYYGYSGYSYSSLDPAGWDAKDGSPAARRSGSGEPWHVAPEEGVPRWRIRGSAMAMARAGAQPGEAGVRAQFSGPALGVPPQGNQVQTPTTDPAILLAGARDLQINVGDQLAVKVFGTPDFAFPVRVTVDGNVQLPFIGLVQVAGLTVNRAEDVIARRLSDAGIYLNPQVTVQVTEAASQFASVGGELHAIVPIAGERRLLDVLAAAGKFPAYGEPCHYDCAARTGGLPSSWTWVRTRR